VSNFIGACCCFTNQYYKERFACDLCITRCYCVPYNHSRQFTLVICWLISALHAHAIRVQFAWYSWYQSSSVALERLLRQVVECSVLLEQLVECLVIQPSVTKSSSRVYPQTWDNFWPCLFTSKSEVVRILCVNIKARWSSTLNWKQIWEVNKRDLDIFERNMDIGDTHGKKIYVIERFVINVIWKGITSCLWVHAGARLDILCKGNIAFLWVLENDFVSTIACDSNFS
jgi:hypothetical protein